MKPLKRILAATDLSGPARHAVDRAYRIAGATSAELTLMHVVNQGGLDALRQALGGQTAVVEQRILDEAREALTRLASELGRVPAIQTNTRLATGTVLAAILDQADAQDADLLVVGSRGESFLRHLLLGATAERLLRRTRRPVLVVKQTPHEAYRRVLVPVDFSPWSAAAVHLAQSVAPGAELVLLHAYEAPFEGKLRYAGVDEATIVLYQDTMQRDAQMRMQALISELALAPGVARIDVRHGDASQIILEQEQLTDCDLIVMGKHGAGMVEELLLGSVTKHILAESTGDVLVSTLG
ncbi:nucleotide-binding universal stress UspA family protein [Sulfuritortus calidifontis]|uniref:Nucleotide-binding universal stress UspA family protein n=1 Tax=Sulfuritortus calidifontis TaxID=1914471 RepID=A0A4R3JS60_9PROT|nr:universal stress protein [Sulfuritortus calidifontis]TCS69998.1 nucleotide-binding universal stress UspA family protein [Sulfuritortus calidifontis]